MFKEVKGFPTSQILNRTERRDLIEQFKDRCILFCESIYLPKSDLVQWVEDDVAAYQRFSGLPQLNQLVDLMMTNVANSTLYGDFMMERYPALLNVIETQMRAEFAYFVARSSGSLDARRTVENMIYGVKRPVFGDPDLAMWEKKHYGRKYDTAREVSQEIIAGLMRKPTRLAA